MQVTANLNLSNQEKQSLIEQIQKSQSELNMVNPKADLQQELWNQMPEAEVTISQEGRKLLENAEASSPSGELRVQPEDLPAKSEIPAETSQFENSDEDVQSGDANVKTLQNIYHEIVSIMSSYNPTRHLTETEEDRMKALEEIWERQQRRDEKNKQLQQWSHEAEKLASKRDGEINKDTADLYIMLKSIEEYEKNKDKAEEAQGGPDQDTESGKDDDKDQSSIADAASGLAGHMKRSMAKSDCHLEDTIDYIRDKGSRRIQKAKEISNALLKELGDIGKALLEEDLSEAEKSELVSNYAQKAHNAIHGKGEMETSLHWGQQQIQDAREFKMQSLSDPQMVDIREVSDGFREAASDGLWSAATDAFLTEAENELNERVGELIDERTDIVEKSKEEKEEKEDAVRKDEMDEEDGIIQEEESEKET